MKFNPNENLEIIYPEETASIISRLLEKYGLKETPEEVLEKVGREEITIGEIIAGIIKEVAENKISSDDLVSALSQRLGISKEQAEKFAKDIKKEILVFVKKIPVKEGVPTLPERKEEVILSEQPSAEKPEIEPEVPPEKPRRQDFYREPIE